MVASERELIIKRRGSGCESSRGRIPWLRTDLTVKSGGGLELDGRITTTTSYRHGHKSTLD